MLLDVWERTAIEEEKADCDDLAAASDIHDQRKLATASKSMRTRKFVARASPKRIKLDHELGIYVLRAFRRKWLAMGEHSGIESLITSRLWMNI